VGGSGSGGDSGGAQIRPEAVKLLDCLILFPAGLGLVFLGNPNLAFPDVGSRAKLLYMCAVRHNAPVCEFGLVYISKWV
jgi:hypothetical protein